MDPVSNLYKHLEPCSVHCPTDDEKREFQELIFSVGGVWNGHESNIKPGKIYPWLHWSDCGQATITHGSDPLYDLPQITLATLRKRVTALISGAMTLEDMNRDGFRIKIKGHGAKVQKRLFDLGIPWGNASGVRPNNEPFEHAHQCLYFDPKKDSSGFYYSDNNAHEPFPILRRRDLKRIWEEHRKPTTQDRLDKLEKNQLSFALVSFVEALDEEITRMNRVRLEGVTRMARRLTDIENQLGMGGKYPEAPEPPQPGREIKITDCIHFEDSKKAETALVYGREKAVIIIYEGDTINESKELFQQALSGGMVDVVTSYVKDSREY